MLNKLLSEFKLGVAKPQFGAPVIDFQCALKHTASALQFFVFFFEARVFDPIANVFTAITNIVFVAFAPFGQVTLILFGVVNATVRSAGSALFATAVLMIRILQI